MPIKDLNNAIGVIFLVLPALIWAIWSFKIYDVFNARKFVEIDINTPDIDETNFGQNVINPFGVIAPKSNQNRPVADFNDLKKKIIEHETNGILGSGVCPLGKFGAIFILCWSVLLIGLLLLVNILYWDSKDADKLRVALQGIGWTNVAIIIIIFFLSLILNPPCLFELYHFIF